MELDIVVAGYMVHQGKLLLIHHKKLNKWLPFGGHMDPNETPDEALIREAREEIGIEIGLVQYPEPRRGNQNEWALPFYTNRHHISDSHLHYCLYYLCKPKSKGVEINRRELLNCRWVAPEDLDSLQPPLNSGDITTCLEAIELGRKLGL